MRERSLSGGAVRTVAAGPVALDGLASTTTWVAYSPQLGDHIGLVAINRRSGRKVLLGFVRLKGAAPDWKFAQMDTKRIEVTQEIAEADDVRKLAAFLERHPRLRMVMAEAGTGWLPWLVQELDYRHWRLWEANEFWADKGGLALETKPSELFKRQIYATFQEDEVAMSLIPFFGEGHLLWASDYPHPDSVWPNSRAAIERQMKNLSPEMRQKLTHDNAAKLYGLA